MKCVSPEIWHQLSVAKRVFSKVALIWCFSTWLGVLGSHLTEIDDKSGVSDLPETLGS